MADNVIASAAVGVGATFAADDIASVHYPRTKLVHGADGTNDGDVATANPLPVELTDNNQTVVADIGNIETNTDSLAVVGGGVEATAIRVTLANDSTGKVTVDTTGTSGLEVIQATAADLNMTEASAAAIKTAVEIIDDWDESDRAKVNIIAGQAGVAAGAGAVGVTVPRVTLASDDPGVALLTTIDSDTNAIKTAVELLDNAVDGNYLNVNANIAGTDFVGGAGVIAAGVQRVTIATDDEVNNLLGTIDADTGAIKTAVEILDNTVDGTEMQVDVVAALPAGTNAIGKLAANSGVDIGDVDVTSLPGSIQGPASPTVDSYAHVAINLTTGANQVLVSSAASKQIWVYGYGFSCGDADGQSVSLQDEDDTAVTGIMEFAQYGGISVPPSGNFSMPVFKLATDKDLEIDITGGDVDGWLAYAIVSV